MKEGKRKISPTDTAYLKTDYLNIPARNKVICLYYNTKFELAVPREDKRHFKLKKGSY